MDMYKKKPLKFSGLGRDVRKEELNAARRSSRLQRFSLLRSLDVDDGDEEISKENVPSSSRIPMLGNQKLQAPSRAEMLKKWKSDRMLKKKFEEQTKKPVFKVGVASKLQSSQASFNKFNRFGDLSKIQNQLPKNILSNKITGGVKSKDIDSKFVTSRSQANVVKPRDILKPPSTRAQVTLPQASKFKTDNASRNLKPQVTARPIQKEIKSKDSNNIYNKSSKVATTTTTSDTKGNKKVPYSGLPKPTLSMLPQRRQLNVPSGINKPAVKSSNSVPAKQMGTVLRKPEEKPKFGLSQPKRVEKPKFEPAQPKRVEKPKFGLAQPKKAENPKSKMVPPKKVEKAQPKKEVQKPEMEKKHPKEADGNFASDSLNPMFPCHLSLIEPVEKSFAPKGFVFRPPIELETSLYLENGPCAIFARIRSELDENIRTSTPKQKEWNECEEQFNISSIKKTPSEMETSTKQNNSANSVPFTGIKFAEPLLLNNSLEIEAVKSFSQNEQSEHTQDQIIKQPQKENMETIIPEISCLQKIQPKPLLLETAPLDVFHPNRNAIGTKTLEQSELSNEVIKDTQIICTTKLSKTCSPTQNEIKESSFVSSPKNDLVKDLYLCSPEVNKKKSCVPGMSPETNSTLEVSLLDLDEDKPIDSPLLQEKDQIRNTASLADLGSENTNDFEPFFQASNVASELDLPQKDQIKAKSDPCLIEIDQATNAYATSSIMLNGSEEDELGSLSDSVFLSRSESDSTKTKNKRFTRSCRSKKPSLLKISESPEIQQTPKRVGTPKARLKTTLGEFTPRRSMRIARLSQLNSEECLFDVKEPLYSSPGKDSARLTYDFDKLHLESRDTSKETLHPMSTRSSTAHGGKISLLYTPTRTRSSSRLKSYGGDLMAFSPNS